MMLTLMGGSIFGLHAFHIEQPDARSTSSASWGRRSSCSSRSSGSSRRATARRGDRGAASTQVVEARDGPGRYYRELKKNTTRGNRADDGRDELGLAFRIDDDLTAILTELDPRRGRSAPVLPGTSFYVNRHPEVLAADRAGRRPRRRGSTG